jgi:hypothetical protein
MTIEEFDANERQAFLVWRRNLARLVLSCSVALYSVYTYHWLIE